MGALFTGRVRVPALLHWAGVSGRASGRAWALVHRGSAGRFALLYEMRAVMCLATYCYLMGELGPRILTLTLTLILTLTLTLSLTPNRALSIVRTLPGRYSWT